MVIHPIIQQEIMKARADDFHRRADRDRIALAARRSRRARGDSGWRALSGPVTAVRRKLAATAARRQRQPSRRPAGTPSIAMIDVADPVTPGPATSAKRQRYQPQLLRPEQDSNLRPTA